LGKEEGIMDRFANGLVIMCSTDRPGMFFVMGEYENRVGVDYLNKPRIFTDDQKAKTITLAPPPGSPPSLPIKPDWYCYKVSAQDANLFNLYRKVTSPLVDPGVVGRKQ
jgi:hypothetical protein